MAGRKWVSYGGSDVNGVLVQNSGLSFPCYSKDQLDVSGCSSAFLGLSSMVSFGGVGGGNRSDEFLYQSFDQEVNGDEDLDDYFTKQEKKRRLTAEQVRFLERSFEVENKLEPERKIQLAKELGLQPRQIAIWFQNRRARWKTKQLEIDYTALQTKYNSLKDDYDNLFKEKDKLQAEVVHLADKLLINEKDGKGNLKLLNSQISAAQAEPVNALASDCEVSKSSVVAFMQEDLSSAKSDELDSQSQRYSNMLYSYLQEPGDSSYAFACDHSDSSQDDEEDDSSKSLLHYAQVLPNVDDGDFFGFQIDDDNIFECWSC